MANARKAFVENFQYPVYRPGYIGLLLHTKHAYTCIGPILNNLLLVMQALLVSAHDGPYNPIIMQEIISPYDILM